MRLNKENQLSIEESALRFKNFLEEFHLGKSNAIKARDLKQWGDARTLRFYVNHLRKIGVPVCSGNVGYWFADSAREIEEITNKLKSHIKDLQEVVKGLDNSLFDMID